jgi:hypothetical protein
MPLLLLLFSRSKYLYNTQINFLFFVVENLVCCAEFEPEASHVKFFCPLDQLGEGS